jgi:competence protein ComEA
MIRNLFATIAVLVSAFALNAHAAVDANQASRADLETVRGIGPSLSGKIVDARKAGDFKSWNDLVERIGGVGPANAARLSQAGLTVAGTTYDPGAMPAVPAKTAKAKAPEVAARTAKTPKAGN